MWAHRGVDEDKGCHLLTGITSPVQAPMLELMHKHMDAKGKQAKLKSPAELQAWPLPAHQPTEHGRTCLQEHALCLAWLCRLTV